MESTANEGPLDNNALPQIEAPARGEEQKEQGTERGEPDFDEIMAFVEGFEAACDAAVQDPLLQERMQAALKQLQDDPGYQERRARYQDELLKAVRRDFGGHPQA